MKEHEYTVHHKNVSRNKKKIPDTKSSQKMEKALVEKVQCDRAFME
jgi:hypothetical protein